MRPKTALLLALAVPVAAFTPIRTMAVDSDLPPQPVSPEHAAGRKAIQEKDWNTAIQSLTAAARRDTRNADVQNLLGYAYRNAGQLEPAFKHYQHALQLDPRHLGAHEYIGEAYLMVNNLAKAEEHLAALKNLCAMVCEERDDLSTKIEEYRANRK